jgi:hypothetical protein
LEFYHGGEVVRISTMYKTAFSTSVALFVCIFWVNSAISAPIAPKAPISKFGKDSVLRTDKPCPDEKLVAVPAYPDSVCLKAASFDTFTAVVTLMTADDAPKVANWYEKHLDRWTRTKTISGDIVFTPPGERTNPTIAAFTKVHVTVKPLDEANSKLKKSLYIFKGIPASIISIQYSTLVRRK